MNIQEFQAKWRPVTTGERQSAHSHFNDLCQTLGVRTPHDEDPHGQSYCFERGAEKTEGGKGWADVWKRGCFAWEYKGNHANLDAAYRQLLQYREDLLSPPLLVVSDLHRFVIRTNWTNTPTQKHEFTIDDLDKPEVYAKLKALWIEPERLKPDLTIEAVTKAAAEQFGKIAEALHRQNFEPQRVAHFLVQLLFGLFAEDVNLLPKGLVGDLLRFGARRPDQFPGQARELLEVMRDGGVINYKEIAHFNGGLFAEVDPLPLTAEELSALADAASLDWGEIEPAIFGTLFERSLDPKVRAKLGAQYTGRDDIERVIEPVIVGPLRRRWDQVCAEADKLKAKWDEAREAAVRERIPRRKVEKEREARTARATFSAELFKFQEEVASVRILDPACGSGNFLYVALAALKDLEKKVVTYATASGLPAMLPRVGPNQLYGLELNEYAHELAQVVVWIGYLQWMTKNGFQVSREPVLKPLDTIRRQDALLEQDESGNWRPAPWPQAHYIIGNPPYLGRTYLRRTLGNETVERLYAAYDGRVARTSDLVCYFFERAREEVADGRAKAVGLLATNSIRTGPNLKTLVNIKESGDIFMAWSNLPWFRRDGAQVRISIVGFDNGSEHERTLDGVQVAEINPDLTSSVDVTAAKRLNENRNIAFMGDTKGGDFDVPGDLARQWLALTNNPNGRPNTDVVKPWVNGDDITGRARGMYVIDFGIDMSERDAAMYEKPFEYVKTHVKPERDNNRRDSYRERWWIHAEPRRRMREVTDGLARFICTPTVSKYRLFVWSDGSALPDHQLIVFARVDDFFFGVLHSRAHEVWSLRKCGWQGVGDDPRYTPTTCFETFPFPFPTDPQREAIGVAAKALDEQRRRWLDPPNANESILPDLTLTNLYNQRPTWLVNAHARLDRAVWDAYGWDDPDPATVDDDTILARLLTLNLDHATARPTATEPTREGREL